MASKTTTPAPTTSTSTNAWGEVDVLEGADLLDKSELIGVPFLITGVKTTINSNDVITDWVEGEREDGTSFTFTDSSTGVKAQLDAYLAAKGQGGTIDEWVDVRLVAPKGLRVSKYTIKDERGKPRDAQTYYLTTNGRRA
jgi:hypothetical protein